MANQLFNVLGGNQPIPGPLGNFANMMQQFNQFRNTFRGDPKQEVQKLLDSGRMTQQQYSQLQNVAQQFMQMMPH